MDVDLYQVLSNFASRFYVSLFLYVVLPLTLYLIDQIPAPPRYYSLDRKRLEIFLFSAILAERFSVGCWIVNGSTGAPCSLRRRQACLQVFPMYVDEQLVQFN